MVNNFEYDFNKDFPPVKKLEIWGSIFMGLALMLQGYAYIFLYDDILYFWIGVFILFGGLCSLSVGLNKNRPLVRKGSHYLKIKDDTISWKLSLFQSKKEVAFKDITKIIFTDHDYFISTTNKVELYLPIRKIHTEKRREFEKIVRAWYKEKH